MNLKITSTEGILYGLDDIVRFEVQGNRVIAIMPFDAESIQVYQHLESTNVNTVYAAYQTLLDINSEV